MHFISQLFATDLIVTAKIWAHIPEIKSFGNREANDYFSFLLATLSFFEWPVEAKTYYTLIIINMIKNNLSDANKFRTEKLRGKHRM